MATIGNFFPAVCTMITWSSRRGNHLMADSTTNPICWARHVAHPTKENGNRNQRGLGKSVLGDAKRK